MNVQRFIGKDNNDAMMKVKRELGSNAVILHTRKIKEKGIWRFFKKPLVEVVAAVETKPSPLKTNAQTPSDAFLKQLQAASAVQPVSEAPNDKEMHKISSKVEDLTSLVQDVLKKVSTAPEVQAPSPFYENTYVKTFIEQDVDASILSTLEAAVKTTDPNLDYANDAQVKSVFTQHITTMLGDPFEIEDLPKKRKILCFVGPTGVGKTTTIAKIAAKLSLVDNQKVSLVTADTYRIAAVDQLKTYGEILSLPLDVIYEPKDVIDILDKHQDKDYVLIDTAGRNHKDNAMHVDTSELLENMPEASVFLVMSCTSSIKDVKRIINSYHFIDDYALIFTKVDEAESYGNLLNAKIFSEKSLAFITNGQSVPDDIVVAEPEKIIPLLLGECNE